MSQTQNNTYLLAKELRRHSLRWLFSHGIALPFFLLSSFLLADDEILLMSWFFCVMFYIGLAFKMLSVLRNEIVPLPLSSKSIVSVFFFHITFFMPLIFLLVGGTGVLLNLLFTGSYDSLMLALAYIPLLIVQGGLISVFTITTERWMRYLSGSVFIAIVLSYWAWIKGHEEYCAPALLLGALVATLGYLNALKSGPVRKCKKSLVQRKWKPSSHTSTRRHIAVCILKEVGIMFCMVLMCYGMVKIVALRGVSNYTDDSIMPILAILPALGIQLGISFRFLLPMLRVLRSLPVTSGTIAIWLLIVSFRLAIIFPCILLGFPSRTMLTHYFAAFMSAFKQQLTLPLLICAIVLLVYFSAFRVSIWLRERFCLKHFIIAIWYFLLFWAVGRMAISQPYTLSVVIVLSLGLLLYMYYILYCVITHSSKHYHYKRPKTWLERR
jgi:hypothetical protein